MIETKQLPNIVFMGPPGVGKGTVAAILAKDANMIHLSTGNIFREEIASKSELGLEIAKFVENGLYVPDEVTNATVKNKIESLLAKGQKVILDGYPRTLDQVEFLKTINNFDYKVVELTAPADLIMQRLNGRRFCPNCGKNFNLYSLPSKNGLFCDNCGTELQMRKDDSVENIKVRQKVYVNQTAPLLSYYQEHNNLHTFDATSSAEEIAQIIIKTLEK
ncbi:adenylate kinase family protein [Mycoplasmopsis columbina]|uniref:adenylate kinase family protein n=1 Tax=Mycoplasmopsis columbina TaxID=114881 RepID=UPI0004A6CA4E|nr:nucleoside monophosphate kinase [Mycoplasmopsis columbina]VEU76777.1 adenylate kinase [Mycoplasmopsis columbina]